MSKKRAGKAKPAAKGGRLKIAAPDVVDADALATDLAVWKRVAIDQHTDRKRAELRAGFAAWYANLLGEIAYVGDDLGEPASELAAALGAEADDLHKLLQSVWSDMAGQGPKCVPAFLAPTTAHQPAARKQSGGGA